MKLASKITPAHNLHTTVVAGLINFPISRKQLIALTKQIKCSAQWLQEIAGISFSSSHCFSPIIISDWSIFVFMYLFFISDLTSHYYHFSQTSQVIIISNRPHKSNSYDLTSRTHTTSQVKFTRPYKSNSRLTSATYIQLTQCHTACILYMLSTMWTSAPKD